MEVASLGTLELGPEPALPEAVAIGKEFGLDLSGHRAARIDQLGEYDLVVGFERKHVMASVVDAGAAVDRTFTLPELIALLEAVASLPQAARERVAKAHAARPSDFRNAPLPEIRDPLGLSAPEQQEIARQVERQVSELVGVLFD